MKGDAGELPVSAVWPGKPYLRGATWDGERVNFALFSEHAEARGAVSRGPLAVMMVE